MSTFIKTGYWTKLKEGFAGYLNLDELIKDVIPSSSITTNEVDAIQAANTPSGTNVFATITDVPVKASGSDVNTGTNDSKFVTAKAIADSEIAMVIFDQFTGYFSQIGTNAPTTVSLLKDSLNTPVWSYSAVGTFLLTKAGAFVVGKTVPDKLEAYVDNDGNKYTLERTSADVMTLKTYAAIDETVLANGVLVNQFINVEVYK